MYSSPAEDSLNFFEDGPRVFGYGFTPDLADFEWNGPLPEIPIIGKLYFFRVKCFLI